MATEHPEWRKVQSCSTSSLIRFIEAFMAEFRNRESSLGNRSRIIMECRKSMLVDFVYHVNTINGEGYDSVPQTRASIEAARGDNCSSRLNLSDCDFVITLNLHDAYCMVERCANESRAPMIRISDIRRLHMVLFQNRKGWEQDAGKFRESNVFVRLADGSYHQFLDHNQIAHSLQELVGKTNTNLEDIFESGAEDEDHPERVGKLLNVAVSFFLNFELIHPFRDGNGRVGRLLLAYLLSSVMPFGPNNAYLVDSEGIAGYSLYKSCFQNKSEAGGFSETKYPGRLIAMFTEGIYVAWKKVFCALGLDIPRVCQLGTDETQSMKQFLAQVNVKELKSSTKRTAATAVEPLQHSVEVLC